MKICVCVRHTNSKRKIGITHFGKYETSKKHLLQVEQKDEVRKYLCAGLCNESCQTKKVPGS